MACKQWAFLSAAIFVVLAVAGCGGGGGGDGDNPDTPQQTFKLELLSGTASVNLENCESANGSAASARFTRLLRATAYKDAIYLMETGEGCKNVLYAVPGFIPQQLKPAIRKLSNGTVETALELNNYIAMVTHPIMVRYPSGFLRSENGQGGIVLGYAAASSDRYFMLDSSEVARYTENGGWGYYVPGLFKLTQPFASNSDLVAGTPGEPPALVDGIGQAVGFIAPHDLEKDEAGVLYVIDEGRLRTIDANYQVETLDHAALGISGTVKALDSDRLGNIYVLAKRGDGKYTWHRLKDGFKRDFTTHDINFTGPATLETFAVVGDDIVMAMRVVGSTGSGESSLFRVTSTGVVKELTGQAEAGTSQDFLEHPSLYKLPPVQHIEYGPDGNLYFVLPQGVLVARDYK